MTTATAEDQACAAFNAYLAAKKRAETTLSFQDGRDAAKAWVTFLEFYLPPVSPMPDTKIIPLQRWGGK